MITACTCRLSATATLACVTLLASASILGEQDEAANIKRKLLGSWQLISWEERNEGRVNYPLGREAVGQIIYTEGGRMSAQLMRRGVQHFANEDWRKATTEEKSRGWSGYFGTSVPIRSTCNAAQLCITLREASFRTCSEPIRSASLDSRASA